MIPLSVPPGSPAQNAPALMAQVQKPASAFDLKIGVCAPMENNPGNQLPGGTIEPVHDVTDYYWRTGKENLYGMAGTATLLKGPEHGKFDGPEHNDDAYGYTPNDGYLGPDSATFLVQLGGRKVEVVYYFTMVSHPFGNQDPTEDKSLCPHGYSWKMTYAHRMAHQ